MVINTNVEAEATKHNLAVTQANLAKSLSRLSSGSKIVNPSDDAAGLAVSNRLEAQVKRIDSALSNVVNATSWTQTQDGFMKNISTAFRRMSELAMLAQDSTKSNQDRDLYNKELQELKNFINDTSKQDYNGVSMFAGVSLDVTVDSEGTTFGMASIDLGNYTYTRATNSGTDAWELSGDAYQVSKDGFTLKNDGYKTSVDLWRDSAGNWSKSDNGGTKIKAGSVITEDVGVVDTNVTVYAAGAFVNSENDAVAIEGFQVDAENNKLKMATAHGLANSDAIKFNGDAPAGLNNNDTYYAKKVDNNNIEIYTDKTLINKVNLYNKAEVTNVAVTDTAAVNAVAQKDIITVTAGNHANDKFTATVNGNTTAAIVSTVGDDNATATALAAAINGLAGVGAAAVGNVITITAAAAGTPMTGATSVALTNTDGGNNQVATVETGGTGASVANVVAAAAGANAKLTKQNHGFSTGDAVVFNDAANVPAGLAADTIYFVNKVTKDTFTLHDTAANAVTGGAAGKKLITADGANLKLESNVLGSVSTNATTDSWSKTGHGLTDADVVQVVDTAGNLPAFGGGFAHSTDAYVKVTSNSSFDLYATKKDGISINMNSTTFNKTAHGLSDGNEVQFLKSAPEGAGYTASYYVKTDGTDKFTLHTTSADATAGTNKVVISSDYTNLTLVKDKVNITTAAGGTGAYLKLKEVGSYNMDDYSVTAGKDNANVVERGYFVNIDPASNGEDQYATKVNSGEIVTINQSDQDISGFAVKQADDYKNINVQTVNGAKIALTMIKLAITKVATDRAGLGATQSRLNFTNDQLNVTKENLSAAISRIADVDVAEEATSYARFQILVATGTQMLKQANQLPQGAIELLR
jgi:flagellin-like hook-associated protein FlgL